MVIHNTKIYGRVAYNLIIKNQPETMSLEEERGLFNALFAMHKPKVIMEIGTAKGGMLKHFCNQALNDATIISLDLPNGKHGGGYPAWMGWCYKWKFPRHQQKLHLIRGNSKAPDSIQAVKNILKGREIDFLFIDADHTYEGAKGDFGIYSKFVRKNGGIVALHDINVNRDMLDCNVDKLWTELQQQHKTSTHIHYPELNRYGVGVVYL